MTVKMKEKIISPTVEPLDRSKLICAPPQSLSNQSSVKSELCGATWLNRGLRDNLRSYWPVPRAESLGGVMFAESCGRSSWYFLQCQESGLSEGTEYLDLHL